MGSDAKMFPFDDVLTSHSLLVEALGAETPNMDILAISPLSVN